MNDKNLSISYLQAFLNENYDDTIISDTLDDNTYVTLKNYLFTPMQTEYFEFAQTVNNATIEVRETTSESTRTMPLSYYFMTKSYADKTQMTSKSTNMNWLLNDELSDLFDVAKSLARKNGKTCKFETTEENKLRIIFKNTNVTNIFPREELLPTLNLLYSNFLINYHLVESTSNATRVGSIERYNPTIEYLLFMNSDCKETKNYNVEVTDLYKMLSYMQKQENQRGRFTYMEGTLKPWKTPSGEYVSASELTSLCGLTISNTPVVNDYFEIVIYKNHKKLFVINDIDVDKYMFACAHALPTMTTIKFATSSSNISIDEILSNEIVPGSIDIHDEIPVYRDGTVIFDIETTGAKTLFLEIESVSFSSEELCYAPRTVVLGDLNMDGYLNTSDRSYFNSLPYRYNMSTYVPYQQYALQTITPTIIPDNVSETVSQAQISALNTLIDSECQYSIEVPIPITTSDCYYYVGCTPKVDSYTKSDYQKLFENMDFRANPFVIHSKLFDYIFDMAIHCYSEDTRIKYINDIVFDINQKDLEYKIQYEDELKEKVFELQLENNIPFPNGYVDVKTKSIIERSGD